MDRRDFRVSAPATLAFVAQGLCWGSFAAQIPVLKDQIGASDSEFGLAMLISTAGAVIAMWSSPSLDRFLGRKALAVLAVALGSSMVLPALASSFLIFSMAMFVAAAFSGSLDVIMNTRVSSAEAALGRPLMSYHHGVFSAAYAVAAFMAGLGRAAGMGSVLIFAVFAVVIAMCSVIMLRPMPKGAGNGTSESQTSGLGIVVFLVGAIILIGFFAEQATEAWSALHLERGLGAGAVGGALGPALLGATMAIGRFSTQYFQNRIRSGVLINVAAVLSATGAFVAAGAHSAGMAYLGFIILGLGVSVLSPMGFAILGRLVSEENRAKAISRAAAFGYIGFFIGPPIMGFLSEWRGLSSSFTFVGIALLLVPLLTLALSRRTV